MLLKIFSTQSYICLKSCLGALPHALHGNLIYCSCFWTGSEFILPQEGSPHAGAYKPGTWSGGQVFKTLTAEMEHKYQHVIDSLKESEITETDQFLFRR